MQPGDQTDVVIHDVAYGGRGVGRLAAGVVFVPGTITGERVRIRIVRQHKSHAEAKLVEILDAAPARMHPPCPLAGTCPGCCYQHMDYAGELRVKSEQLTVLLQRLAGIDSPPLEPAVAAPQPLAYRNKIVLHRQAGKLGYYAHDNRSLLDVPHCALAHDAINRRLTELRAGPLQPGNLTLRHTPRDGVQHWQLQPGRTAPWLYEDTPVGTLRVPRGSFFQVNPAVAGLLVRSVERRIAAWRPARFMDAYCGVGVFALAAGGRRVPEIRGVDSDPAAIRAARHNARGLGHANIVFEKAGAEAWLHDIPVAADTVLMLDPPRTGLTPGIMEAISAKPPARIMYCACAADMLARDLRRLIARGYHLESAQLFDMFPRTMHFECLACLRI